MNILTKRLLLLLMLLGLAAEGAAQDEALYLSSRQQPVRFSFGASYQSYAEDGGDLTEFSLPVAVSIPLGRRLGVSLLASQASASGDNVESVSGISDAQVGLSYYQQVGQGSVVISLGANLPSGKRELTQDEFETSIFLSRHFYNFRVPGFGQGFNLSPGIVVAVPVSPDVVLGVGASYQIKGGYKPIAGMDDYDPGDEILLTGGFDYRVSRTANLSADVTYTLYGSDTFSGQDVYTSGDKLTVTAQVLSYLGLHELRLVGRFRSLSKGSRPAVLGASDESLQTLPGQVLLRGSYRHRVSPAFTLGLLAQARLFDETDAFEARNLFDAGLTPVIAVSDQVALQLRFIYTLGDFTGFEAGGGLVVEL